MTDRSAPKNAESQSGANFRQSASCGEARKRHRGKTGIDSKARHGSISSALGGILAPRGSFPLSQAQIPREKIGVFGSVLHPTR